MNYVFPSPAALQLLIEIAQIANLLCDDTPCCEEDTSPLIRNETQARWKDLHKRLRLFRDNSFLSLASEPTPSELQHPVLESANHLLSYVLSARLENTCEWMNGLCEAINKYAAVTGETDRVEPYRDSIRIIHSQQPANQSGMSYRGPR